jgi:hypothetical protein
VVQIHTTDGADRSIRARLRKSPLVPDWAFDLYRLVRAPGPELAVWRDYWRYRDDVAFLRDASGGSANGKTVLVLSLANWVYQIKLESVLAIGLKLAGWIPRILLDSRRDTLPRRYFQAIGLHDFVYLEDYPLTETERETCRGAVERFQARMESLEDIMAWEFMGSWIGPQVLSSFSREDHQSRPDVADPATRKKIIFSLGLALPHVMTSRKVIDDVAPATVIAVEANYVRYGPLIDMAIARGSDAIQAIQPWRDDALNFKRLNRSTRRTHPSSLSARTLDRVRNLPWSPELDRRLDEEFANRSSGRWARQERNQPGVRPMGKSEIIQTLRLNPSKKTAVVFSHILWDANMFYGKDLFPSLGDWFIETIKAARANPAVNWVIKMHPANIWKRKRDGVGGELDEERLVREKIGPLPDHVRLLYPDTPVSTYSLFEHTDYAVTVRGTPGMEAPCFGIPAITAGTGRYSGLGFTIDPDTSEAYLRLLAAIQDIPPLTEAQTILARKHALAVFSFRPWIMKSFTSTIRAHGSNITDPLDHNMTVNARSMEDIHGNGDLEKWAAWAGNTEMVDYLDLPMPPAGNARP